MEQKEVKEPVRLLETEKVKLPDALLIHSLLHNESAVSVTLHNEFGEPQGYPITIASNGCRQLYYNGIRFMTQNKRKVSAYAELAKKGHQITWGIRGGQWIYILDGEVKKS